MYKKPEVKKVVDVRSISSKSFTLTDAWSAGWNKGGTWTKKG